MNGHVVVDASIVVKWLTSEHDSDRALELLQQWQEQEVKITAPHLMPVEVTNALYQRVARNEASVEIASRLADSLLTMDVEFIETVGLHGRALELAAQLRQGAVYDSHYLALAETLQCELWTADERFYRVAGPALGNVQWIGEPAALA